MLQYLSTCCGSHKFTPSVLLASALQTDCACSVSVELQGGKAIVEEAGPDDSSVSHHKPAIEDAKDSPNGRLNGLAVQ